MPEPDQDRQLLFHHLHDSILFLNLDQGPVLCLLNRDLIRVLPETNQLDRNHPLSLGVDPIILTLDSKAELIKDHHLFLLDCVRNPPIDRIRLPLGESKVIGRLRFMILPPLPLAEQILFHRVWLAQFQPIPCQQVVCFL